MRNGRFFSGVEEIGEIVGPKLEEMLEDHLISQKDGGLFFTYWVNMEPYEHKPLVVDEQGQFWIGKRDGGSGLVFEEYGSHMSRLLDCPSPE
ncbi:MAG: hypothetical protein IH934_05360 [Nanoarchaeota archaeon]|nr:hypothetical protein [Nanoarchaeota archaeon]